MVAQKVWNGTSWEFYGSAPVAQVQAAAPAGPAVGQLWLDTATLAAGAGNGAYVCTSTTRPSSPTVGLIIFETDTTLTYIWNGAAWRAIYYPLGLYNGSEVGVFGATPTAGTPKVVKQGTIVTTVTSSLGSFTFPEGPFLNGIVTVVMISGDGTAFNSGYSAKSYTLGTVSFSTIAAVAGPASVRVNYIAYGW